MATPGPHPAITAEGLPSQLPDIDPDETADWLESLDGLLQEKGRNRARFIMLKLLERARARQVGLPALRSSDYINTIPPESEPWFPGDEHVERRIRAFIRWNAAIMVSKANRKGLEVGGHIATYQSAASLYEVGFNHFFRGKDHPGARVSRHLRPGVPGRSADHRASGRISPGGFARTGQGIVLLPTPETDATLLGVPDGLHGHWCDQLDLSGAL